MKNYIKSKFPYFMVLLVFLAISCETINTDLIEDPSNLNQDNASIEFVFNAVQLELANFFEEIQFPGAQVTRMELMGTSPVYESQFRSDDFDTAWTIAYANFLKDAQLCKQLAEGLRTDDVNGNNIIAAVQIMEAYVIVTLADYFGDIPYSEALQGSNNFNPAQDDDQAIYESARMLLENAIQLIDEGGSVALPTDLYYNADTNLDKWKRLANSFLIKLAVSSRLNDGNATARVNAILNENIYINNNNADFQFNYGTSTDPESRHPIFVAQYQGTAGIYMAKPYLRRLRDDPRFNYYFNKQSDSLFGREHGDSGPFVSSELNKITVHGLYPVGGKYNNPPFVATSASQGAQGAGASIIMTNFSTQFLIAEAQLMMNSNPGAARTALFNAITASIAKVKGFRPAAIPSGAPQPTAAEITAYIDGALIEYDNASSPEGKLNIIITEYYKSLWGNGIETYNNFRRTGYPADLPPSISDNPGVFTNTMFYPAVYVNFNGSPDAVQRPTVGEKVWWAEGTSFNLNY